VRYKKGVKSPHLRKRHKSNFDHLYRHHIELTTCWNARIVTVLKCNIPLFDTPKYSALPFRIVGRKTLEISNHAYAESTAGSSLLRFVGNSLFSLNNLLNLPASPQPFLRFRLVARTHVCADEIFRIHDGLEQLFTSPVNVGKLKSRSEAMAATF
jgi:hypothetical protein